MARPRLIFHKGVWHVVMPSHMQKYGCSIGSTWDIMAEGSSPAEAWESYTGRFDVIIAESERVVWGEAMRLGKKALPVILALAAGILIGVAHGKA